MWLWHFQWEDFYIFMKENIMDVIPPFICIHHQSTVYTNTFLYLKELAYEIELRYVDKIEQF
jgi:hypothetical protein